MSQYLILLSRSYSAIGDVIALFVVLPLLVRTFHLHDMTIVIIAVLSQATKSLVYFFSEDKSHIYAVIAFSVLHCINTQPLRSSMTKLVGQGGSTQISTRFKSASNLFQIRVQPVCRGCWRHFCLRGRRSSHFWICDPPL